MRSGSRASAGREGRRCPRCGGRSVPIVYGLPGPALERDAARGKVVLGGCGIDGSEPTRQCGACGHAWRPAGARFWDGLAAGPPDPDEGGGPRP